MICEQSFKKLNKEVIDKNQIIVMTPVKNAIDHAKNCILSVLEFLPNSTYFVIDDFSNDAEVKKLGEFVLNKPIQFIDLKKITQNPSPNYDLALGIVLKNAYENKKSVLVVESDVVLNGKAINSILQNGMLPKRPGLVGAITQNEKGEINYPYQFLNRWRWKKKIKNEMIKVKAVSFCCTLIGCEFISDIMFENWADKKGWYDLKLSRWARKLGYENFLCTTPVLHYPHSSRPWKNEKYENFIKYYFKKWIINKGYS